MGTYNTFDIEEAIREGWARDQEDEVSLDGYNAFLQITTSDGSSGFSVVNIDGGTAFASYSDGDGYFAKDLVIENITQTSHLRVTEGATNGYVLTADANGNATWQAPGSAQLEGYALKTDLDGYITGITVKDNGAAVSSNAQSINFVGDSVAVTDLGGGEVDITISNTSQDLEEQVTNIQNILDGYLVGVEIQDDYIVQTTDTSKINFGFGLQATDDGYGQVTIDAYGHSELDELVHNIAEDSFEEIIYSSGQISSIITWTDIIKVKKIREEQYTYSGNKIVTAITTQYDATGSIKERLTETFAYSGGIIQSITRTVE